MEEEKRRVTCGFNPKTQTNNSNNKKKLMKLNR